MASWFYASNSEQVGPVEDAELLRLLREGRISGATLVWKDGLPEWVPLAGVRHELQDDLSEMMPRRSDGPAPQPGQPLPTPNSPVAGSGGYGAGAAGTHMMSAPLYDTRADAGFPEGPAWEDQSLPFFGRIWETLRPSLLQPREFFSDMRRAGDYTQPMIYLAILGFVGTLIGMIWQMPFQMMSLAAQGQQGGGGGGGAAATGGVLGLVCTVLFAPVVIVILAWISAGIYHLVLSLLGGANEGYEATFRVVCYSSAATTMLNIIPCVGGCVGTVWMIVMLVIGLSTVHETDGWKAAVAVIAPIVLCLGAVLVGIFLIFGAAFGAAAAGGGGGF